MIQVVITLDPQTNQLSMQSPLAMADTLVLLERVKLTMIAQANRTKSPLEIPTTDQSRRFNGHGK